MPKPKMKGEKIQVNLTVARKNQIEILAKKSNKSQSQYFLDSGLAAALNGVIAYGDEKFYQRVDQEMKNMMDAQKKLLEVIPEEKKQMFSN